MSIFVGSFEHVDTFHRVCTILATTSIVIAAVYMLRLVGKVAYGKVFDEKYRLLTDATWDEKLAVICLIFCIAGVGCAPWWLSSLISHSVAPIINLVATL
jgi:NADH-quinone oxidoreductase subunit M